MLQLITFQLGQESYAVDIMKVKEIHAPCPVRPIPNSPSYLEGVFSLRGDVIPLVNLHRQFNIEPLRLTKAEDKLLSGFIILKISNMLIAVIIDKVLKVVSYNQEHIQKTPRIISGISGEYLIGMIDAKDNYLSLIDVNNLFSQEELKRLNSLGKNEQFNNSLSSHDTNQSTIK